MADQGDRRGFTLRKRGIRVGPTGQRTSVGGGGIRTGAKPLFRKPSPKLLSVTAARRTVGKVPGLFQPGTRLDPSQVQDRRGQQPRFKVPPFMRIGNRVKR